MKFGTQLPSMKEDLEELLKKLKGFGCEGLEVSLPVADLRTGKVTMDFLRQEADRLRRAFSAQAMEFISLTPGIMLKHVELPDVIKATGQIAKQLGVRQVRMFFAPHVRWGGPNSKLDAWMSDFDGTHDARYWIKRNREELKRLLDISADADVRYVFELHHGFVVNSASAAMRMLDALPSSKVGILMDPGNMVFEGNEGWRNSVQIMGDYLAYIHCKNGAYRQENGRWMQGWAGLEEGIAHYDQIMTALKDIGFNGYLSIEDLRGNLSLEERVGKGISYLKRLRQSAERVLPT